MASNGHFDFESQTWVHDGETPPERTARVTAPSNRRTRGASESFLLIGGLVGTGLGLVLLVVAASSGSSGNIAVSASTASIGGWLLGLGLSLLVVLLVINAFIDVWQRRMREPE